MQLVLADGLLQKIDSSMAKGDAESKLALAGVVTLAVALAGVLLVKEPLRSSRPVGTGLDVKQTTGKQSVRARLWEDPVAAVQRGIREAQSMAAESTKPEASMAWTPTQPRLPTGASI